MIEFFKVKKKSQAVHLYTRTFLHFICMFNLILSQIMWENEGVLIVCVGWVNGPALLGWFMSNPQSYLFQFLKKKKRGKEKKNNCNSLMQVQFPPVWLNKAFYSFIPLLKDVWEIWRWKGIKWRRFQEIMLRDFYTHMLTLIRCLNMNISYVEPYITLIS